MSGYLDLDFLTVFADIVGRRTRMPPRLLEFGIFGLDFNGPFWPDHTFDTNYNYESDDDLPLEQSLPYVPSLHHYSQKKDNRGPPEPEWIPAELVPTQVEKRKSLKKRLKKKRQKERRRLAELKKEKEKTRKNAEEKPETTKAKENDKVVAETVSSSCDSDSSSSSEDGDNEEEEEEEEEEECSESQSESEELDMTSSFVNKAALRVKQKQKEAKPKPERKEEKKMMMKAPVKQEARPSPSKAVRELPVTTKAYTVSKDVSKAPVTIYPTYEDNVKRSTEFAILGNQHASAGRFDMAVEYFTCAIKYNPKEFKLFGNRSFCFEKLQQYEKALTDAQLSLNMAPDWVKGLYRKGRALAGLKRYQEAASTFSDVLRLDKSCTEAAQWLMHVQINQLMECGFTREHSSNALIIHGTLAKAKEALSKLSPIQGHSPTGTIYKVPLLPSALGDNLPRPLVSLPSAFPQEPNPSPSAKPTVNQNTSNVVPKAAAPVAPSPRINTKTKQEPPKPLPELFPIWVGNVHHLATEALFYNLFSSVGRIHSIKILHKKQCAFVNFTTKAHCNQAIHQFNGHELMGSRLVLRYPDRIPPGMGMSKAALKAENQDIVRPWESVHWKKGNGSNGPPHFAHRQEVPEDKGLDHLSSTPVLKDVPKLPC